LRAITVVFVFSRARVYVIGKLRVFHVIGKLYVCLRDAQHGRPLGWIVRLFGHPNPGKGVFSIFLGRAHVGERKRNVAIPWKLSCGTSLF
jgi:hypothetical protein